MNIILKKILARLDEKLARLNQLRPIPKEALRKLKEQFSLEMTYNSNAIEGNTLTLKETFWVISEGITIKGKPLKHHLEAKDHSEALRFLDELIEQDSQSTISEHLIRTIHQLVVKTSESNFAGKYRDSDVFITGSGHIPPDAFELPFEMQNLISRMKENQSKIHPIELATKLHHKLVFIHPFFDGNGRTARIFMNIFLMRAGFPMVIILKNDRKKYYSALDKADKGNIDPLIIFIAQCAERSLDIYLNTLEKDQNKKEKLFLLSEVSKQVDYSSKYLNLLIRQGKLEAIKKGRNWQTSLEAIKRYKEKRERMRK